MAIEYETRTKTYKDQSDFNKDAEKMTKDGWSYDAQMIREGKRDTETKVYRSTKDFQRDSERRSRDGWEIANSVTHNPRSGCMRIIMLGGIGALVFKPKPEITVTYSKAEKIVTWSRPKS